MITDQIVPAHILRLYTWEVLKEAEALALVNGKNPIIPLEDEPELSDAGKNYIIYGYSENDINRTEYMRQGTMAFRVIAQNSNDLSKITSIIARAFENSDIATEAVNIFSSNFAGGVLIGLRFTNVKAIYVESADPATSESGPVEGTVSLTYRYINNLPIPMPESVVGKGLWV
jgi:hypothetical protein